jgi:uncharacterized protein
VLLHQDEVLLNASYLGSLSEVALAIVRGANVDVQDSEGNTPLHWAVFQKNQTLISLLLNCGARLLKNKLNISPLGWASSNKYYVFLYIFSEA